MYGPMGDGSVSRPTTSAQELAAMMYGSRYSGDMMGDGPADDGHDQHHIFCPELQTVGGLLYPSEQPHTNIINRRSFQLTANVMRGDEHAAAHLIRHLIMLPEGD
jgi:hypothetical protein